MKGLILLTPHALCVEGASSVFTPDSWIFCPHSQPPPFPFLMGFGDSCFQSCPVASPLGKAVGESGHNVVKGLIPLLKTIFKFLNNLIILEELYKRQKKVCMAWRQAEIVSDGLQVVYICHVWSNRIYVIELREGKTRGRRASGAGGSRFCCLADP